MGSQPYPSCVQIYVVDFVCRQGWRESGYGQYEDQHGLCITGLLLTHMVTGNLQLEPKYKFHHSATPPSCQLLLYTPHFPIFIFTLGSYIHPLFAFNLCTFGSVYLGSIYTR